QLQDLARRGVIPGMDPPIARGWIAGGPCAVGGFVAFGILTFAPIALGVGAFGFCSIGVLAVGLGAGVGVLGLGGYVGVGVKGLGLIKSRSTGTPTFGTAPGKDG